MTGVAPDERWDATYRERGDDVSWFETSPDTSLDMIHELGLDRAAAVIDIGGGASTLVDHLLDEDFSDLTVLDLSEVALGRARSRLGDDSPVEWVRADVTAWESTRTFDLWHDRAVFHFLTDPTARDAYLERLRGSVRSGWALIATFAPDGPESCSGMPVQRYSADELEAVLEGFDVVSTRRHVHTTPWGAEQPFTYVAARRS
jgi:trans-aconitate methyltransferase